MTEHMTIHLDAATVDALKQLQRQIKAEAGQSELFVTPSVPELARHAIRKWCTQVVQHGSGVYNVTRVE